MRRHSSKTSAVLRFRMKAAFGLLLFGFAGTAATLAQTVREQVKVDVVTVRVTARDASGHNVTDLKPSELALLIDGQPTTIETFSLVSTGLERRNGSGSAGTPDGDSTVLTSVQPGRTAIFLDEGETKPSDRSRAYGEISKYIENPGTNEEFLVARFDGLETNVVTPWTSDGASVRAALKQLAEKPGRQKIVSISAAEAAVQGGSGLSDSLYAGPVASQTGSTMELNTFRTRLQKALLEVLSAFPPGPSTKRLVFVTSGTLLVSPAELAAAFESPHVEQLIPIGATCNSVACLRRVEANRTAFSQWTRAVNEAANDGLTMDDVVMKALEHDVALVPLATDPLAGGQNLGLDSLIGATHSTASLHAGAVKALWQIAEESGSEPILVPGKAAARLSEIGGRATYELTFRDPFQADPHVHSIGLICKRRGVHIEYRRGFRIQPEDERALDSVVARLARTADAGPRDEGVAVTLSAAESSGVPLTRVRLTFEAPGESEAGEDREFDVIAVGERDDGARTEPVRWTAVAQRIDESCFSATTELQAPYGRYAWSFAVRDVETSLTSYALVPAPSR